MRRLFIFAAIVLVSCAGFCLAQDNDKADKYAFPPLPQELKHADSLLAAGDSTKGLAELRAIVNSKAGDEVRARAQYSIGEYYRLLSKKAGGDYKKSYKYTVEASKRFKAVADNYSKSVYRPWALLFAASNSVDKKDSKVILQEVINNYPKVTEVRKQALRSQSMNLYLDRDYKDAITAYRQYIKDYPEDRYRCADALYHIGLITKDNSVFEEVIEKYPDQANIALLAYDRVAGSYGKNGDYNKSIEISLKAIEKYKTHPSISIRLMSIYNTYREQGEGEKADEIKQRILKEYPNSEQAKEIRSWSQPQK